MSIDWLKTRRKDTFTYQMLDPNSMAIRGQLTGVIDGKITLGYYTDTRVSGSLTVVNPNYIENSLIRIYHHVEAADYTYPLGTFFVDDISRSYAHGVDTYDISLSSMLCRISDDVSIGHFVIPKGAKARVKAAQLMEDNGMAYAMGSVGANAYKATKIYDFGENLLSILFDLCEACNARLDVDGNGVATVMPYISPSKKTPIFTYDAESLNSIVYGDIKRTSTFYDTVNRVGVAYEDDKKRVIQGAAYLDATHPTSRPRRGRRVTKFYSLNDDKPTNNTAANTLAEKYLKQNQYVTNEYQFDAWYYPLKTGDVINLKFGGKTHKCMLKTRDISLLPGLPTSNTVKEV